MNSDQKETKKDSEAALRSPLDSEKSPDELENYFDDILSRLWPSFMDGAASEEPDSDFPTVDIVDRDNEIEVRAALPGVDSADLYVSISNQSITIQGIRQEENLPEDDNFYLELARGGFKRTVLLPDHVMFLPDHASNERVMASFKDGLLKITLPKIRKAGVNRSKSAKELT
ncbi:MAG: Hsp20/alpha crystallin family protein [Methylosarcina sp.]